MTDDQERLLAVFKDRVRDLKDVCKQQKQKISELTGSLESKNKELQQAMQTIEEMKARYDNLLTAKVVSGNETEMKSAKTRLSKLVREVDRCIALLNE
jgi:septal ring factor EnvC (AmiA/AmiB activator)